MYSLKIMNPNSVPHQIKLTSGKMVIGRTVNCDIVINDTSASRRHAEIFYDPAMEIVTINDLKSSNGTYVNRKRVPPGEKRALAKDDIIQIGAVQMRVLE